METFNKRDDDLSELALTRREKLLKKNTLATAFILLAVMAIVVWLIRNNINLPIIQIEESTTQESNRAEEEASPTANLVEYPEYFDGTYITMVGWWFCWRVHEQVERFNEENELYRIQLIDFQEEEYAHFLEDMLKGELTFDILYTGGGGYVEYLIEQNMLMDLWVFIDEDSEMNREDFFLNILEARQRKDGSLPVISNGFTIRTMITLSETVSHLDSWTFSNLLALVHDGVESGMDYPIGRWVPSDLLLLYMVFNSPQFIDLEAAESALGSPMFFDLLELLSLLSIEEASFQPFYPFHHEFNLLREGEHLFSMFPIFDFMAYIDLATIMEGEEVTYIGIPSEDGGFHAAQLTFLMGISASSENPYISWSFIRQFLLPEADIWGLPTRIDLFQEKLEEAMREEWIDVTEGGEEIGLLWRTIIIGEEHVHLRPLSEENADSFRNLVESVTQVMRFEPRIYEILMEELEPFLEGDRDAFETAMTMQIRVQTMLNVKYR